MFKILKSALYRWIAHRKQNSRFKAERQAYRLKQQQAILHELANGETPASSSGIDLSGFPFILREGELPLHVFSDVAHSKLYKSPEGDLEHYEVFGTLAVTTYHVYFCDRNGQAFRIGFDELVSVSDLSHSRLAIARDSTDQRTLFSISDNEAEFAVKLIRLASYWMPKPEKQPHMGLR